MNKLKKTFGLLLTLSFLFSLVNTYAMSNDDVYYEIEELTEEDFGEVYGLFDETANTFTALSKNDIKSNGKLVQKVSKTMYIQTLPDGTERKLTVKDKALIDEYKTYIANSEMTGRSLPPEPISAVKNIYNLTLIVTVGELWGSEYANEDGYMVVAEASWTKPGALTSNSEKAHLGDDCLYLSWGGSYDYTIENFKRTYTRMNGDSSDVKSNIGAVRNVNGTANQSRGWAFPETLKDGIVIGSNIDKWYYLSSLTTTVKLSKPSFGTGTTKLYLNYVHTYSETTYNFSLGAGSDGLVSCTVTPTTSDKYWTDFAEITIKK